MEKVRISKENGKLSAKALRIAIDKLVDGVWEITIKKVRGTRSLDQNGYLFGVVYPMLLDGLLEAGWELTCTEEVHEFCKQLMLSQQHVNKHTGEVVSYPNSTAKMTTVEFSTYTDKIREYAIEYLGLEIPDPDPSLKGR